MYLWKKKKHKKALALATAFVMAVTAGVVMCPRIFAEEYVYNAGGKRDPFIPLAGDTVISSTDGLGDVMSLEDVALQGIVISPDGNKSAIINGEILTEGAVVGQLKVVSINSNEVIVELDGNVYTLKLYE